MNNEEKFCWRYEDHKRTLSTEIQRSFENATFVDCALIAEDKCIFAHKVILSAFSEYFWEIFCRQCDNDYSIVSISDIKFHDLQTVIEFMYKGELAILKDQLQGFLNAVESLRMQVKGLSTSSMVSIDNYLYFIWADHQNKLLSGFETFLENALFIDCTIEAEEQFIAHKIVLSAFSQFFAMLPSQNNKRLHLSEPVILQDIKSHEFKAMIDLMYKGEFVIRKDQLECFLLAAKKLQIKGLPTSDSRSTPSDDNLTRQQPNVSKFSLTYKPKLPSNKQGSPSITEANVTSDMEDMNYFIYDSPCSTSTSSSKSPSNSSSSDPDKPNIQELIDRLESSDSGDLNNDGEGQ